MVAYLRQDGGDGNARRTQTILHWTPTHDGREWDNGGYVRIVNSRSGGSTAEVAPISPPRAVDFQRPIAPPFNPDQSRSNCLTAVLADSGTCCCPCFSRSSLSSFAETRAGRLTPVAGV
ncbi:hypothetical protein V6N11_069375 [Hibiscus sabdariffa]|uniref:Uncharacterized protein n=2 Tax=Hibiscus sabdariffa TaxID=183260 RepID=A0ABR1Z837_9ROSI